MIDYYLFYLKFCIITPKLIHFMNLTMMRLKTENHGVQKSNLYKSIASW